MFYQLFNFLSVLISRGLRCAAEVTDGSQYFVLLMITDGVISDMAQTKESVVNVSMNLTVHVRKRLIQSTDLIRRQQWFVKRVANKQLFVHHTQHRATPPSCTNCNQDCLAVRPVPEDAISLNHPPFRPFNTPQKWAIWKRLTFLLIASALSHSI